MSYSLFDLNRLPYLKIHNISMNLSQFLIVDISLPDCCSISLNLFSWFRSGSCYMQNACILGNINLCWSTISAQYTTPYTALSISLQHEYASPPLLVHPAPCLSHHTDLCAFAASKVQYSTNCCMPGPVCAAMLHRSLQFTYHTNSNAYQYVGALILPLLFCQKKKSDVLNSL